MREYEVIVVIQPNLDEDARNGLIERVGGWLTAAEGDKPEVKHWGQRRLAYPIKNQKDGYYVLYEAKVDPGDIPGIERQILYVEDILRYLVVRKEE